MSKNDDDYQEEKEHGDSQVRSIIRQLNEETPAKEKTREVVVRPDGSKVVRVTKKRKVMISQAESRRRSRRSFMVALFVILLALGCAVAFFSFRMSAMSGETYLAEREQELCRLWGAASVKCTGATIDGVDLRVSSIVAEFPEDCMIERIELSEVKGMLDLSTFFTGVLTGEDITIARANIRLRGDARELHIPQQVGEALWRFERFICPDFSISLGDEASAPWGLRHCSAYMYYPQEGMTVVTLDGGVMNLKGWKDIKLKEGKFQFSPMSLEEFMLTGSTDVTRASESARSSITISGRLLDGYPLAGPYYVVADNMNLSEFTQGRFNHFFKGQVVPPAGRKAMPTAQVTLPLDSAHPLFSGSFNLKEISITSFSAIRMFCDHIDPVKRKRYLPPAILFGAVRVEHANDAITLIFDEADMVERDLIALRGRISVNEANALSGTLDYGLPVLLTRVEYPDGISDPIFKDDGQTAWLCTTLSGVANNPEDDSVAIEARAVLARQERPARTPFQEIDLDRLTQEMNMGTQQSPDRTVEPGGNAAGDMQGSGGGSGGGADGGGNGPRTQFPQTPGLGLPLDDDPFASPF